jgi:hypothetical protein
MKYFFTFLTLAILFLSAACANAVQVKATWEFNDPAEQVEGYILYERTIDGKTELLRVDAQTNEAVHEHTGDCKTYLLTAYRGDIESHPAVANFCPEVELPPIVVRPGQPIIFNIMLQNQ